MGRNSGDAFNFDFKSDFTGPEALIRMPATRCTRRSFIGSVGDPAAAVAAADRIVQVGSWHRSDYQFRPAAEMVRQGRIGTLQKVDVAIGKNPVGGPFAARPVPRNLDGNLWQGQTPDVPYVSERAHYPFRWWQAYSGGKLTDWGAHHIDIARWVIGSKPVEIEGRAKHPALAEGYDVPLEFAVRYRFANGVELHATDEGRNGIRFTGSDGKIFVNRGIAAGNPVDDLRDRRLSREAFALYDFDNLSRPERTGKIEAIVNHMGNFFDCVATRRQPIADVEAGHRSVTAATWETSPASSVESSCGIRPLSGSWRTPRPTVCSRGRSGRGLKSVQDDLKKGPAP